MSDVLKGIERRIFQARGAFYEGDIFSVLSRSPFVVRAFEFGLADGAIDCSGDYRRDTSFADRFWNIHNRRHTMTPPDLVLFDVKSTVGEEAGEQLYIASTLQQRHVAFFIGITAGNPDFVDIIPNYAQEKSALEATDNLDQGKSRESRPERDVSINTTRTCKLPSSTYGGLDQCQAPYRLPISLLPEAIARIRQCALYGEVYVNPANLLSFPEWHPLLTQRTDFLAPAAHTDQFSAYELVLDILRITNNDPDSKIKLDFVGVQPRLADFRLTLGARTVWVQHKLDMIIRSASNDLSRVPAARALPKARGSEESHAYFFSTFDRFDFLWYQFCFSKGNGITEDIFYFIPEKAMPDLLFASTETMVDFGCIENLDAYRVVLDDDTHWLATVERIILAHTHPRAPGDRPIRQAHLDKVLAGRASKVETRARTPAANPGLRGRHDFAQVIKSGLRRFFASLMTECAARRSGLLVVFATNHPIAELGFCRYRWSKEELERFLEYGLLPKVAHSLPPQTTIVPICYGSQYAETSFQGPNVRAAHFRQLDSSAQKRLLVWDIGGADTQLQHLAPAVIPSGDIQPTASQRELFAKNVALDKNAGQREAPGPNFSSLLSSGKYCADYAVDSFGPTIYDRDKDRDSWASMWRLLSQFTGCDAFEHPAGCVRDPAEYLCTLQSMHASLKAQQQLPDDEMHEEEH